MSEHKKWLDTVIPQIIGNIEPHMEDVCYELIRDDHRLLTNIFFVCVKYRQRTNGLIKQLSLVIKKPRGITLRDVVYTIPQFRNEILFYKTYCQSSENFPRCFYAYESSSLLACNSVIALENVQDRGFKDSPCTFNVPHDYVLAVMRALGRFHAKGYVMKEKMRTEFFHLASRFQKIKFIEFKLVKAILKESAIQVVNYLRDHGHDAHFCDKLEVLFSKMYEETMLRLFEPAEPLSTICHGDLTLDNMFFKTQSNGRVDAMLIDFACLTYNRPVIDLSTFLCLSCTNETIRNKLPEILRIYHSALTDYMLQEGVQDIQQYSYAAILDDYKRGCLIGFIIAAFYLPCMLRHVNFDLTLDIELSVYKYMSCKNSSVHKNSVMKILTDLLLQMHEDGCLDHFL
ncbi:hypothetical protein EAI_09550 [Harpegnathos saltator]|uniref:CHK kinase-like domain-containing protein n=2 Tax=Harpegnathos saltator TaxID=610380 RepID=E2BQA0_HARSA|nr:hypothetical protein EAI_09550 [Harpegnathos saltator]